MRRRFAGLCSVSLLLATLLTAGPAGAAPDHPARAVPDHGRATRVCQESAAPGVAACDAHIRTDVGQLTAPANSPYGFSGSYGPADLWSAYNLSPSPASLSLSSPPAFSWNGQTIAIVDAYNDPNAETDLATYRRQFNLSSCTHSNGCFLKINQAGQQSTYPAGNTGWSEEISLDIDMASAICPNCRIMLVEAQSTNFSDLGTAVNKAATLSGRYNGFTWTHANAISNSYGGGEFSGEQSLESYYNHPGIVVTASSGDGGYGVEYPAASQYVTAVGGTSLTKPGASRLGGWAETVWSGAGSGCSAYIPKPTWQTDASCTKRTVADVAAVADPNTGVLVYDTYGLSGWYIFGGTSVASPIVASVYALALAGNASSPKSASSLYAPSTTTLFDVTSGSNGTCGTATAYLCTGEAGYDGPTGNGTPNGLGGF
jgi:subtilase family serine protease